jgi:hypothetical protein
MVESEGVRAELATCAWPMRRCSSADKTTSAHRQWGPCPNQGEHRKGEVKGYSALQLIEPKTTNQGLPQFVSHFNGELLGGRGNSKPALARVRHDLDRSWLASWLPMLLASARNRTTKLGAKQIREAELMPWSCWGEGTRARASGLRRAAPLDDVGTNTCAQVKGLDG